MAEYNAQLDAQISQVLGTRGRVTADDVAGFPTSEAAGFLAYYAQLHGGQVPLVFDGVTLTYAQAQGQQVPSQEPSAANSSTGATAGGAPPGAALTPTYSASTGFAGEGPTNQSYGGAYAPPAPGLAIPGSYSQPVAWGWWILPVLFGFIGGIIAWAVNRQRNPSVARGMLAVGVAFGILSGCFSAGSALHRSDSSGTGSAANSTWAASASGKPTFYYFGTST